MPSFIRLLDVTSTILSSELYSLMARCLRGEATPLEEAKLADRLATHTELNQEYDSCCETLLSTRESLSVPPDTTPDLQKKFDRITRRLKDEGSL